MWRVMTGRHTSVEVSFMLVGHTKFSPDRFFGLFKKAYRRSTVSTIFEISRQVELSTATGQNIPQLVRDNRDKIQVKFYQWTAFLGQFFRTIPNISTYHNFRASEGQRGDIELRQYSSSEKTCFNMLKSDADTSKLNTLPELTHIPGLDLVRQWYLYENIRQHCQSTLAAS